MNERPLAAVLLALPILYVTGVLLPTFPSSAPGVAGALAVSLVIAALTAYPSVAARDLGAWVGIALSLFFALAVWEPGVFGDTPAGLAVGVLLGLPWIAWVYVWRDREPLANRLVAYALALTLGVLLLATLETIQDAATAVSPDSFVSGFYSLNLQQIQGIATLLSGGPSAQLPAHDLFDPFYAALVAVSTVGLVVLVLRPRTGDDRPLPITLPGHWEEMPARELSPSFGFSEAQRVVFRERSLAEPPSSATPPGLAAVISAALATVGFVAVAFLLPYWALLSATAGLTVAVLLLATSMDLRYRAEAPEPPAPPPGSEAPPPGALASPPTAGPTTTPAPAQP